MLTLTNGFDMHLQRSGWGFRFGFDGYLYLELTPEPRLSHRQALSSS